MSVMDEELRGRILTTLFKTVFKMFSPGVIFIQLVISTSATNPYRDKINITSCENEDRRPEMTYVAPEYLISTDEHHTYERRGNILKRVVTESELKMFTYDDCKFEISSKILWKVL